MIWAIDRPSMAGGGDAVGCFGKQIAEAAHAARYGIARKRVASADPGPVGGGKPDRRAGGIDEECRRCAMVQDEGHVVDVQHEVDRNEHRPQAGDGIAQRHEIMTVAGEHCDPVARNQAMRRKRSGKPCRP